MQWAAMKPAPPVTRTSSLLSDLVVIDFCLGQNSHGKDGVVLLKRLICFVEKAGVALRVLTPFGFLKRSGYTVVRLGGEIQGPGAN